RRTSCPPCRSIRTKEDSHWNGDRDDRASDRPPDEDISPADLDANRHEEDQGDEYREDEERPREHREHPTQESAHPMLILASEGSGLHDPTKGNKLLSPEPGIHAIERDAVHDDLASVSIQQGVRTILIRDALVATEFIAVAGGLSSYPLHEEE